LNKAVSVTNRKAKHKRPCPERCGSVSEYEAKKMPRPSLRSRTLKRIKIKVPGGARIIHYIKKRPGKPRCALCSRPLSGTARGTKAQVKGMSRSQKTPTRAYGGNLCPACSKEALKDTKLR